MNTLPPIGARVEVLFGIGSSLKWRPGVVKQHEVRGYPERPIECVRVEIDGHTYLSHPMSVRVLPSPRPEPQLGSGSVARGSPNAREI